MDESQLKSVPSFQYVIKEYIKSTYSKIEVEFILTSHSIIGDLVGRKTLLRSLSMETASVLRSLQSAPVSVLGMKRILHTYQSSLSYTDQRSSVYPVHLSENL